MRLGVADSTTRVREGWQKVQEYRRQRQLGNGDFFSTTRRLDAAAMGGEY